MTTSEVNFIFSTVVRTFQLQRDFPASAKLFNFRRNFKVRSVLSKFVRIFPASPNSLQFRLVLSNFGFFQLKRKLSNFGLSNFSFFPNALCNYTYLAISDWKIQEIIPMKDVNVVLMVIVTSHLISILVQSAIAIQCS